MPESQERERSPMVKLFSLWESKNKDGTKRFWSTFIKVLGIKIIMFRNRSPHPQAPMFDVFVTSWRDPNRSQTTVKNEEDDFSAEVQQEPKAAPASEPEDEKLPF